MTYSDSKNRLQQVFIAVVIIAVASALAFFMVSMNKPGERKLDAYVSPKVTVQPIVLSSKTIDIHSRGLVSARTQMPLLPEVSGKVVWVSPKWVNGGFFLKDEPMLKIEKQKYRNQVAQAKSSLMQARSQLIQEQGIAYVAKKEWEGLLNNENKAAEALALRKPQLASAQAHLESTEEALVSAQLDLTKTDIKAPYDGLLSNKEVDIGQFLRAGQNMARFYAVDFVEVRIPLTQAQTQLIELPTIGKSSQLAVRLISQIGEVTHEWKGTLVRTEGLLDEINRVLFGVIEVKDPYGLKHNESTDTHQPPLMIGAFVEVILESKALQNIATIPRRLLRSGNHVWLVNDQEQLEKRKVDILPTRGSDVFVFHGLNAGDRVVISPMADPVEGRQVEVKEASAQLASQS